MPATLLEYWAEDYDSGTNTWANRGSLGSLGDLSLTGTAPTKGTDATGPYVDFAGVTGFLETTSTFSTSYVDDDWTVYALFDVVAANGFIFDLQKSGKRVTLRSEAARIRVLDSSYRDFSSPGAGNLHYAAYVLNGTVPEMRAFLVDDVADASNPAVYNPQVVDAGVRMAIGALATSGSTPFAGKVRAISIAGALHDAPTRAQAQAAHEEVWTLP